MDEWFELEECVSFFCVAPLLLLSLLSGSHHMVALAFIVPPCCLSQNMSGKAKRKGQRKRQAVRAQAAPVPVFAARYAVTFGEQAETRTGMEKHGSGLAEHGFSVDELRRVSQKLEKKGVECDFRVLSDKLDEQERKGNEAAVLLIKNGIQAVLGSASTADSLLDEQSHLKYDRERPKRARW